MPREKLFEQLETSLWSYYRECGRDLPWRRTVTPYRVVVSELMLQQTQVVRVKSYFTRWMRDFPSWQSLSQASRQDVLMHWQGLGYNRRALYLSRIAQLVRERYNGRLPREANELEALPGIGPYTRGAIRAFAYNIPDCFVETNIRTVLFYHLYSGKDNTSIGDSELLALLQAYIEYDTRAQTEPRQFYYAMMDYGSYLKGAVGNLNTKSTSYSRQTRFAGSRRQLRSHILHFIVHTSSATKTQIRAHTQKESALVQSILDELVQEGSISRSGGRYYV